MNKQQQVEAFLNFLRHTNGQAKQAYENRQWEEALQLWQSILEPLRGLAEIDAENFAPWMAGTLGNISTVLGNLGKRKEALETAIEVRGIFTRLAKTRPEAFMPDLATSLNNLSLRQSELGQREAALTSIAEAVSIRRALAEARPEAFLPDLAGSLHNLSTRQSGLGQREAALASISKAVSNYRALAEARPEVFLPYLAASLNNLSAFQSGLGQREAALTSIEEAVSIRRALAEARPEVFLPDLASSLNNLSAFQRELGQREAALTSISEAVSNCRALAEARPEAFLPNLAMSLNNLSLHQRELGQREAALASIEESVKLYQTMPFIPLLEGIKAYRSCASLYHEIENYSQAASNWQHALILVEENRQLSLSVDVNRQSIADYANTYDNLSNCQALNLNDNYGALSTIESSKSRLLLDLSLAMDNDTTLGKKRRNLQTQLHVVRKQLDGDALRSDEEKSMEALREEEKQLTQQLIAINEQIKQANPDYKAFDSPLDAEQIVQLAQEQRCSLLTFRPTNQGTLIFLALPTGELKSYHNVDFSNQMLNEFLVEHWLRPYYETFMQSYFQYQDGHIDEAEYHFQLVSWLDAVNIVSDRLYQELFTPIYADLQAHADAPLVLAPSRGLSILPLHAASYKKANDARRYLLDDFTVQYTPSFTFFQRLYERERQRSKIGEGLLVLDPLKDIHEIGYSQTDYAEQVFPSLREGSTGHLRHEAATEAAFLQRAPEATLLHLTCHGNYDMQYPLDSAFSFADNEQLSIGDLLTKLELPKAWHVTLSACETSLVELGQPADDHFGLASSFLLAGAPSVWGTLWSVSQGSTSEIIKQAYKYLFTENLSKAQALRKAQLEYKQKQSHPFYWAGLHHVGA